MNLVLIIPASLRDPANQIAELMGWGAGCYSVPLSPSGSEPASHYALNLATVEPEFLTLIIAAKDGEMPEELRSGGYPPEAFASIMDSLIVVAKSFAQALRANDLKLVESQDHP